MPAGGRCSVRGSMLRRVVGIRQLGVGERGVRAAASCGCARRSASFSAAVTASASCRIVRLLVQPCSRAVLASAATCCSCAWHSASSRSALPAASGKLRRVGTRASAHTLLFPLRCAPPKRAVRRAGRGELLRRQLSGRPSTVYARRQLCSIARRIAPTSSVAAATSALSFVQRRLAFGHLLAQPRARSSSSANSLQRRIVPTAADRPARTAARRPRRRGTPGCKRIAPCRAAFRCRARTDTSARPASYRRRAAGRPSATSGWPGTRSVRTSCGSKMARNW